MKNFLLLLIIGVLTNSYIYSQSLEIKKADGSAIVNDTILIATSDNTSDIEVPLYIKNISDVTKDVFVKLYVKQFTTGSSALYCWNSCFDIATSQSTNYLTVNAGDTIKDFHSTLTPNGNTGITEIMYTFFINKNDSDSASVTITYDILTTSIQELSTIKESIKAYPNPVRNTLHITYDRINASNCSLEVYDLVGKKVKSIKTSNNDNTLEIDVSDFKPGIYIWSFEVDGIPVKSEKFMKE
ncbi:MAG: T9SS type A sorting domain-containing protein [Bacteroidetes bacterium]|nr:T9SS type A sorting domain-containing protein [Bacteroidota bacterium]